MIFIFQPTPKVKCWKEHQIARTYNCMVIYTLHNKHFKIELQILQGRRKIEDKSRIQKVLSTRILKWPNQKQKQTCE